LRQILLKRCFYMKEKIVYRVVYLVAACVLAAGICATVAEGIVTQQTLLQYGSRGTQVKSVQQRLKQWGYYTGSVDGVYGTATKNAVMYFQRKNGLKVDGKVGPQTLAALGLPSGTAATPTGTSTANYNMLARIISAEARGEPYNGLVAVGAVIMNRVDHPSFPNTLSCVIYQPGAFTAVDDGQINTPLDPNSTVVKAANDALNGWDPTSGCVYYWNPATATSKWIWSRQIVAKIGKHYFGK
jgi:N-acetylmuramoyl-L-alanine amidase